MPVGRFTTDVVVELGELGEEDEQSPVHYCLTHPSTLWASRSPVTHLTALSYSISLQ